MRGRNPYSGAAFALQNDHIIGLPAGGVLVGRLAYDLAACCPTQCLDAAREREQGRLLTPGWSPPCCVPEHRGLFDLHVEALTASSSAQTVKLTTGIKPVVSLTVWAEEDAVR